jgi:hypothetical protein
VSLPCPEAIRAAADTATATRTSHRVIVFMVVLAV